MSNRLHSPTHASAVGKRFDDGFSKVLAPEIKNVLDRHPALVAQAPRAVDVLLIGSDNLHSVPDELPAAGGMAIDLDRLPVMNAEQIDGLLVALRSLAKDNAPVVFIESISRIQSLHTKAGYHGVDLAMARIEDGSGISEAAALPMTGRSKRNISMERPPKQDSSLGFLRAVTTWRS